MAKKSSGLLKSKRTFSGSQILLFILAFAAVGAVAIWQSLAAPHNKATVTMQSVTNPPAYGSDVSFLVNADVKDSSKLWVTNSCSQNGVTVYSQSLAAGTGSSGPFTLKWPNGGSASCVAYAWLFPNGGTWLGSITYSTSQ